MWRLLCPHCSWAVAGQVEGWIDKAHSPVEKARSNSWKRLQENTHTPRGTDKVLATCTPSLISFVTFFSWHWVGSQGNWGTDHHTSYSLSTEKEGWGCLIMRKGKIGQNTPFSQDGWCGGNLFVWGNQNGKELRGMKPGTPLFLSQPLI